MSTVHGRPRAAVMEPEETEEMTLVPVPTRQLPLVGYYRLFTWLTYGNAACGILGICYAMSGRLTPALVCLILAGVCDMFDGTVAKRTKRTRSEKLYGMLLDSLADLISFGLLPAAMALGLGFHSAPEYLICMLFVLCGLIRLAYFDVTEIEMFERGAGRRTHYKGLPITSSAILVPLAYLIFVSLHLPLLLLFRVLLPLAAVLFIAPLRVPKLGMRQMVGLALLGIPVIFLICRSLLG